MRACSLRIAGRPARLIISVMFSAGVGRSRHIHLFPFLERLKARICPIPSAAIVALFFARAWRATAGVPQWRGALIAIWEQRIAPCVRTSTQGFRSREARAQVIRGTSTNISLMAQGGKILLASIY